LNALLGVTLRLRGEVERLTHANRTREDYDLHCTQCGKAHILDTVLPSEIWNQIAAPEDLLCTLCIDDRLAAKGLTFSEAEFYYGGPALQSSLYNRHDKARADALQAALMPAKAALEIAHTYILVACGTEVGQEKHNAERDLGIIEDAIDALTDEGARP